MQDPFLSVVVTSRNDDPGGELNRRTAVFADTLARQCHTLRLPLELVVVEWNPQPDRPPLAEAVAWPEPGWMRTRIVTVAPELHAGFPNAARIPLFQMIAKNVGIRRAKAPFVLATNVDVLFSMELMAWLADRNPDPGAMYRLDRCDIPPAPELGGTLEARMDYCRGHVIRIYAASKVLTPAGGRKFFAPEADAFRSPGNLPGKEPGMPPYLHTNACGDFTLLSRDAWMDLRGYPELPLRAFKLDGLLCYAAHYAGFREQVLAYPLQVYHMDHGARGDGADVAIADRARAAESPLAFGDYSLYIGAMRRNNHPMLLNGRRTWGLGDRDLPETAP
ncbi:MAG: hypothetical protein GYA47_08375 [Desulfovibrio sp.]|nr:hypothetical protein [Desulfovibrio sp.]